MVGMLGRLLLRRHHYRLQRCLRLPEVLLRRMQLLVPCAVQGCRLALLQALPQAGQRSNHVHCATAAAAAGVAAAAVRMRCCCRCWRPCSLRCCVCDAACRGCSAPRRGGHSEGHAVHAWEVGRDDAANLRLGCCIPAQQLRCAVPLRAAGWAEAGGRSGREPKGHRQAHRRDWRRRLDCTGPMPALADVNPLATSRRPDWLAVDA